MNKTELVEAMAIKAELSKKDTEKALKAFEDIVTETLATGEKIQLVGFGTFETTVQKPREVGNPKDPSQGKWMTEEKLVPKFKAGKSLKDAVKEGK